MTVFVRSLALMVFALAVLPGCSLVANTGAEIEHIELHAPLSFRASGEPFLVSEWDPWSIVRAQGCLLPGQVLKVQARRKGNSLMVSLPGISLLLPAAGLPGNDAQVPGVAIMGTGAADDPYVVRFAVLHRWQTFARLHEMEDAVASIVDAEALRAFLDAHPDIASRYFADLDRFNDANRLPPVSACARRE